MPIANPDASSSSSIAASIHSASSSISSAFFLEEETDSLCLETIPWKTSWAGWLISAPAPFSIISSISWRRQVTWATHSRPQTWIEVVPSRPGAAIQ